MIIECPNCETHYEIPVELPPEGRKVRCAACQHVWIAKAEEEKPEEAKPEEAKPEKMASPDLAAIGDFSDDDILFKEKEEGENLAGAEPAQDSDGLSDEEMASAFSAAVAGTGAGEEEPVEADEPESPPIVIGKAKKKSAISIPVNLAAGWAGLGLAIIAILGIGYYQRVNVVRMLPGAASTYERIGIPVNVRGLEFEKVKYSWESSAGRPVLEVFGDIVNVTPKPLKVPTVVFSLRTKEKVEVYQWAADVRADLLPPGARTAFSAQIPTPPKSIRDVQVRFAKVQ